MAHDVALIPGDGIGPEITEAMRRVVDASGAQISWHVAEAGAAQIERCGTPLPPETIELVRELGVAIKGPVTTQFEPDAPEVERLAELVAASGQKAFRPGSAISVKPISAEGSRRIVTYAFEYARRCGRKKVTAVHKANIMKATDGLFLRVAREVAESYPDIAFEDKIVDACCMGLVQDPGQFDVLVLPNLYGDIVSDLCAGLVGGLGMAPGANIGDKLAVFEATHGSAPDIAGKDIANPTAEILSAAMMLDHLGEAEAAARVRAAVTATLAEGTTVTADVRRALTGSVAGAAGTAAFAAAVIACMSK